MYRHEGKLCSTKPVIQYTVLSPRSSLYQYIMEQPSYCCNASLLYFSFFNRGVSEHCGSILNDSLLFSTLLCHSYVCSFHCCNIPVNVHFVSSQWCVKQQNKLCLPRRHPVGAAAGTGPHAVHEPGEGVHPAASSSTGARHVLQVCVCIFPSPVVT